MRKISFAEYANARDEMPELNEGPLLRAMGNTVGNLYRGLKNTVRTSFGSGKRTYDIGKTQKDVSKQQKSFQDQLMQGIDDVVAENEAVVTSLNDLTNNINQNIAGKKAELDGAINQMITKLQNMKVRGSGERLVTDGQIKSIKKVTDQLKQISDSQKNTMINLLRDMSAPVKAASGEMGDTMRAYDRLRGNITGMLAEIEAALEQTHGQDDIQNQAYTRSGVNVGPPDVRKIPTQNILAGTGSSAVRGKGKKKAM